MHSSLQKKIFCVLIALFAILAGSLIYKSNQKLSARSFDQKQEVVPSTELNSDFSSVLENNLGALRYAPKDTVWAVGGFNIKSQIERFLKSETGSEILERLDPDLDLKDMTTLASIKMQMFLSLFGDACTICMYGDTVTTSTVAVENVFEAFGHDIMNGNNKHGNELMCESVELKKSLKELSEIKVLPAFQVTIKNGSTGFSTIKKYIEDYANEKINQKMATMTSTVTVNGVSFKGYKFYVDRVLEESPFIKSFTGINKKVYESIKKRTYFLYYGCIDDYTLIYLVDKPSQIVMPEFSQQGFLGKKSLLSLNDQKDNTPDWFLYIDKDYAKLVNKVVQVPLDVKIGEINDYIKNNVYFWNNQCFNKFYKLAHQSLDSFNKNLEKDFMLYMYRNKDLIMDIYGTDTSHYNFEKHLSYTTSLYDEEMPFFFDCAYKNSIVDSMWVESADEFVSVLSEASTKYACEPESKNTQFKIHEFCELLAKGYAQAKNAAESLSLEMAVCLHDNEANQQFGSGVVVFGVNNQEVMMSNVVALGKTADCLGSLFMDENWEEKVPFSWVSAEGDLYGSSFYSARLDFADKNSDEESSFYLESSVAKDYFVTTFNTESFPILKTLMAKNISGLRSGLYVRILPRECLSIAQKYGVQASCLDIPLMTFKDIDAIVVTLEPSYSSTRDSLKTRIRLVSKSVKVAEKNESDSDENVDDSGSGEATEEEKDEKTTQDSNLNADDTANSDREMKPATPLIKEETAEQKIDKEYKDDE